MKENLLFKFKDALLARVNKNILLITFIYIFMFILSFQLIKQINFWHNDEWVYYPNVENLLKGNFKLNALTAPTFYTAGFIGASYAKFFGINSLPILTLIVSLLSGYLIALMAYQKTSKWYIAVLISCLIVFSPLFVFTSIGFLTDNYFILFFIASFFAFEEVCKKAILLFLLF